ncbi:MAG TPA: VCBS repeat-containing protein, partial [Candidatus Dormibacteraeota bacterium]|nr:VCBS repeat-containing protein [Candidatus Dormibacteraeota bacterium]
MIRRYTFANWSATCGLVVLGCAFAFRATTVWASTCAAPNLQPAGTFSAGSTPVAVIMGDFNADGKLDLAVANKFSGNVSILLGKGDGTFLAAVNYAMGSSPSSVATGDLNGDGRLDLAVTDAATGTVWIRLGVGDGTFLGTTNYVVGSIPQSVAVSDFNGDGKLDLAVANRASGDVSVLLGNGDGTFQSASNYAAGVDPLSIAVGDFNQDHKLDLVVANAAIFDDPPNVSVFLGNGDGTFQAATNYTAGRSPRSVAVGDLNGDSKLDLAVANHGIFENGHFTNSSVSVLLGNGNGTFQPAVNYTAGDGP